MISHEFRPGRLIAGLAAVAAAVLYAADAADVWHPEWFAGLPVVFGGLVLAGVVGTVFHAVLRRRRAHRASTENIGAPATSSGNQPIR